MWWKKPSNNHAFNEDGQYTYLGKGVHFKGQARLKGTVRVDGRLEGDLYTNDTLIIGQQAVILGSVTGKVIISSGKIVGNITATEKVQLCKPAIILGDIATPTFSVEEGVLFQGLSSVGLDQSQENKTVSQDFLAEESDSVFQKLGWVDKRSEHLELVSTSTGQEVS